MFIETWICINIGGLVITMWPSLLKSSIFLSESIQLDSIRKRGFAFQPHIWPCSNQSFPARWCTVYEALVKIVTVCVCLGNFQINFDKTHPEHANKVANEAWKCMSANFVFSGCAKDLLFARCLSFLRFRKSHRRYESTKVSRGNSEHG